VFGTHVAGVHFKILMVSYIGGKVSENYFKKSEKNT
jgi:hypothetical protein